LNKNKHCRSISFFTTYIYTGCIVDIIGVKKDVFQNLI